MTITEFSNEFDIHYDNIATKGAPGLDLYEKSVYLTRAQLEIVKRHYGRGNKYQTGFEQTEKRRVDLKELIKNYITFTPVASTDGISPDSKFYNIPNELMFIIQEDAVISSTDTCLNGKLLEVIPKTHDEFNRQRKSPFKKPNDNKAWRMDYSRQNGNKNVEIISPHDLQYYKCRYLKYPSPIILTDLSAGDFLGEGLTIEGLTQPQTSELDQELHPEIVALAVELADVDYKDGTLNSRILRNSKQE